MRTKFIAGLMALVFLLAPSSALFAQDEAATTDWPIVYCGDLTEEDCALLKTSQEAMATLESHTAQLDLSMSLADLPTLPADLGLGISTDGILYSSPELTEQLMDMQKAGPEALLEDMNGILDLVATLYFEIAFDIDLGVTLTDDLAELISAQAEGFPVPTALELPIRMKDGYFYVNVDDLATVIPGAEEQGVQGWLGIDMGTLVAQGMEQAKMQLEEGNMSPEQAAAMDAMTANLTQQMALQKAMVDYVQVERLENSEIDGVEVGQFLYTFDLPGFVGSPEFMDMVMAQVEMQMAANPELAEGAPSPEEMESIAGMAGMMAPMLLQGLNFETLSSIGLEDGYVYATETHVDWDLSTIVTMAAAQMEGVAKPKRGAKPLYTFDLMVTNGDFDDAPAVEAPADAQIIPLETLESMPQM